MPMFFLKPRQGPFSCLSKEVPVPIIHRPNHTQKKNVVRESGTTHFYLDWLRITRSSMTLGPLFVPKGPLKALISFVLFLFRFCFCHSCSERPFFPFSVNLSLFVLVGCYSGSSLAKEHSLRSEDSGEFSLLFFFGPTENAPPKVVCVLPCILSKSAGWRVLQNPYVRLGR